MSKLSWADALKAAIDYASRKGCGSHYGCHLCIRDGFPRFSTLREEAHDALPRSKRCMACPVGGGGPQKWLRGEALGYDGCGSWATKIRDGNLTALRRARQLEAYIRKHPRKWMHMEPEALAREVKKVKV